MNRETMPIPVPKARDGDAVVVTVSPRKGERGHVVDDPKYVDAKHGAGWRYRVRFDDGSGTLDIHDVNIERAQ